MRSDAEIREDVRALVRRDPSLGAADLSIEVARGFAIVSGQLATHARKRALERCVFCVPGVKGAIFETRITLDDDMRVCDLGIADAIHRVLIARPEGCAGDVRPTVEQGWVTLRGTVARACERQRIERAVCEVAGIEGITNAIELLPLAVVGQVERNIDDALVEQARRDGRRIEVDIDGATVTLRGCVHSDAERDAARRAALYSYGVDEVVDALTVRA